MKDIVKKPSPPFGKMTEKYGDKEEFGKIRIDVDSSNPVPVSRVLCLRDLPSDATEFDTINLASPFGCVSSFIFNKKGSMALLELSEESQAVAMVDYYTKVCSPKIRCRGPIVVAFSKYASLTDAVHSPPIVEAIQSANCQWSSVSATPQQHMVLHVQADNLQQAMHLTYRHYLLAFLPFGTILRIVSFKTGVVPKAFIEFADPVSTCVAKVVMSGAPFFSRDVGACVLRTDFSHQSTIEVHQEDANCRDFIHNPLSEAERAELMELSLQQQQQTMVDSSAPAAQQSRNVSPHTTQVLLDLVTDRALADLGVPALCQLASRLIPHLVKASLQTNLPQASILKSQAGLLENLQSTLLGTGNQQLSHDIKREEASIVASSPVVYVSNLNKERVTPDTLFILFGVYGDVHRVKIMRNKSDAALVQLSDPDQAQLAVLHLNGVPLYGSLLRCSISKNQAVTMAPGLRGDGVLSAGEDDKNTREYAQLHRLHRFKLANSRNLQNVCAPSKFLHVSNIPDTVSEEEVKNAFESVTGCTVVSVKIVRLTKPMALIQMENLDTAVTSLVAMHDYEISPDVHIRVSFSKSAPRG